MEIGTMQNETADMLAKKGARTKLIGLEPFLPTSLSRYKSKMKNWTEYVNKWNGKPVKNIGLAKYVWKDLPIGMSNVQTNWIAILQGAGGAPYRSYQPEIHVAQDVENKITIIQEMPCRKRNIGIHK